MAHEPASGNRDSRLRRPVVFAGLIGVGLLWATWPSLVTMVERWSSDPRYSHGYLVPAFSLFLLWWRRDRLKTGPLSGAPWAGMAFIAVGAALKLVGGYYFVTWIDTVSLVPSLAGICLLVGGWTALSWAWPAIVFLIFMIPMPYRVENALGAPLQRIATIASTYILQTLGLPAVAEGNIILMNKAEIGVVEACNGLGMLLMFFAFSTAVVFIIHRPLIDKAFILLSAIPTALLANIIRITVTGLLHETAGSKVADAVYHDLAGWLMMPLALGALWLELQLLSHLFVEPAVPAAVRVDMVSHPIGGASRRAGQGGKSAPRQK